MRLIWKDLTFCHVWQVELWRLISRGSNISGFAPVLVASKVGHWCRMRWYTRSRQKLDNVWVTSLQVCRCAHSLWCWLTLTKLRISPGAGSLIYAKLTEDWKKWAKIKVGLFFLGLNCYVGCLALPSKQVANDNVTWNSLTNEGVLHAKHHTTLDSIDTFFFYFTFFYEETWNAHCSI